MKVISEKQFIKDLRGVPIFVQQKTKKIIFHIQELAFDEIGFYYDLQQIIGDPGYFRIRIGDYRIGIFVDNRSVTFIRLLHRGEIYKKFP